MVTCYHTREPGRSCFRGKYYPLSDFLSADPELTSPVWSGLLAGHAILRAGGIWQVRDGARISIWEDHWLPSVDLNLGKEHRREHQNLRVFGFIDHATMLWKVADIKAFFHPEDVAIITGILLSRHSYSNTFTWWMVDNGQYTVRSAYNLAYAYLHERNLTKVDELWCWVWSLKLPPRVHIFLWRVLSNILATRDGLPARGVRLNLLVLSVVLRMRLHIICFGIVHLLLVCGPSWVLTSLFFLSTLLIAKNSSLFLAGRMLLFCGLRSPCGLYGLTGTS